MLLLLQHDIAKIARITFVNYVLNLFTKKEREKNISLKV